MKLFVSYASADGTTYANALVSELEAAGRSCWIAPRDVKPGPAYGGQIIEAIEEGVGLVLIVTPMANGSQDVLQEVHAAHKAKKTIAPVVVGDTALGRNLQYYLDVRHQTTWSDSRTAAQALLTTFAPNAVVEQSVARPALNRLSMDSLLSPRQRFTRDEPPPPEPPPESPATEPSDSSSALSQQMAEWVREAVRSQRDYEERRAADPVKAKFEKVQALLRRPKTTDN